MLLHVPRPFFCIFALLLIGRAVPAAVILQDNFDGGDRPKGNKGDINFVGAGESLNGYWAQFPDTSTERWRAISDGGASGGLWQFGGISEHPNPPLPGQTEPSPYGNGMIYGKGAGTALLPFSPTAGIPYELAADLFPAASYVGNTGADWVALGFTSSSVTGPNLEDFGLAWVKVRNNGTFDFQVGGSSPAFFTGSYTRDNWVNVALTYDPAERTVSLQVNHGALLTTALADFAPTQIALEVNTQSNESLIAGADWVRLQTVPEPGTGILLLGAAGLLGHWRSGRRHTRERSRTFTGDAASSRFGNIPSVSRTVTL